MRAFEDRYAEFARWNTQVLGISVDSVPGKKAWAETLGVKSFPLLSDFWPHGAVSRQYGVLRPEGFSERAIFVVGKDGRVRFRKVYPTKESPDLAEILDVVEELERSR